MTIIWRTDELSPTLGASLCIPQELVDMRALRADLTITNPLWWKQRKGGFAVTAEPTLELWEERGALVVVPRHYTPPWRDGARRVKDVRDLWRASYLPHGIDLRDDVQREASAALQKGNGDKILSLSCGRGKTVTALHGASEGERMPTLIVVHTNALLEQWRDQICKFYRLKPSDVGHIQAGVEKWRGKKIAVAMLHTLIQREFSQEFYDYWRLVIYDELHRVGAASWMKVVSLFRAERWGLSATVDREDKMEKAFKLHTGDVVYKNVEQPLVPQVHFIDTDISVDLNRYMFRGGRLNTGKLYTDLSANYIRNGKIFRKVMGALDVGRTILVLGERTTQLHDMHERVVNAGGDSAVYTGAMKAAERKEALKHQIVWASQSLAKEGLDRPAFDTLVIAIPFAGAARLQQSVGRILRIKDGKKTPKVLIFRDDISLMRAIANKMRHNLEAMGFKIGKEI